MNRTGKTIVTFVTGVSIGIVAGILIAPQSGKRTRDDINYAAKKASRDFERANWQFNQKANKLQKGIKKQTNRFKKTLPV